MVKIFGYIDDMINHVIGLVTELPWYLEIPIDIILIVVAVSFLVKIIRDVW